MEQDNERTQTPQSQGQSALGMPRGALRDKSVGTGGQAGGKHIRTLRSAESKVQARELELSSVVFFKPSPGGETSHPHGRWEKVWWGVWR